MKTTIVLQKALKNRITATAKKCGYGERELQKFITRLIDCVEESPSFFKK